MERKKLIEVRLKHRWSQAEAAEHIGVNAATLCRWEQGKSNPSLYNIRLLSDAYQVSPEELGLDLMHETIATSAPSRENLPDVQAFIHRDLTMRLMCLAFMEHQSFQDLQDAMTSVLEECPTMTMNEALITRRDALSRLVTLPILTLGLSSQSASSTAMRNVGDTLRQCAAGVAAARELVKSEHDTDLSLAYQAVSAYLPTLQIIMRDSSQYRKQAANIAAQCSRIKTALGRIGWHAEGLSQASTYAQEAVNYATEADDSPLLVSAILSQAWVCYYDRRGLQGVNAIAGAVPLLKHSSVSKSMAVRVLSTQAVLEAKNGRKQESSDALRRAHKMKDALSGNDYYAFTESLIPEMIGNEGMALYHGGNYNQALDTFAQLIDPSSLKPLKPLSGKGRVEMLNFMALSSLKAPKKDMDQTVKFWAAGIEGAKTLQSKQRFNESLAIYDTMEAVWPGEKKIEDLRVLTSW